tara:strand:- start:158 stop:313 length:156 start_codon:yes stop_codon:yes gene_type:complete
MIIESHHNQMRRGASNWIQLQKQNVFFMAKYSFKISKKFSDNRSAIGEPYA